MGISKAKKIRIADNEQDCGRWDVKCKFMSDDGDKVMGIVKNYS